MKQVIKILKTDTLTHDVKRFVLEKPKSYQFAPGQATEVAIDLKGYRDKPRPFTFTNLNDDSFLELIVKAYPVDQYPEHTGVTEKIHQLKPGDRLIIDEPWGTINYRGPGIFIAGGAGITPFIAIFRQLSKDNQIKGNALFFSNKTKKDIILETEWRGILSPDNLFLVLTQEKIDGYENRRIDQAFLKEKIKNFSQNFYVCGPKPMVLDLKRALENLGAKIDVIVFEQ